MVSVAVRRYFLLVLLFGGIFLIVGVDPVSAEYNCFQFDGNQTGCTSGNASSVCMWDSFNSLCNPVGCGGFSSNSSCTNASVFGAACQWDGEGNFCEPLGCWNFGGQGNNACVNNTAGLSCSWDNSTGQEWCGPLSQGCSDIVEEGECFGSNWCAWNGTACLDPIGEGTFGEGVGTGVGCFMFNDAAFCGNVTGCTWTGNSCTGSDSGVSCGNINESSFCNDVPFLTSCCAWSAGSCNATFDTSCWNIQPFPIGASYCEDFNAIDNQTLCSEIVGPPWYMPCKWHNQSTSETSDDRCGFNGDDFFGEGHDGGFEDIGSESTCEAAGGVWKTESFVDFNGNVQQDTWCEMGFGISFETCDSACWACEFNNSGGNYASSGEAQAACEGSLLGYCKWTNATANQNAPDGFGFCDKPDELLRSGCGISTGCEDYNFYTNPQISCQGDVGCDWFVDPQTGLGSCAGVNTKTCVESCSACFSEASCLNNGTSCDWDSNLNFCKSQTNGVSAEICFNGIDDDNDNMVDCADSSCLSDSFCGGGVDANNCGQWINNNTCLNSTGGNGNCIWNNDPFTNASWCDAIGTNCWQYDDDEVSCGVNDTEGVVGCAWRSNLFGDDGAGLCDVNESYSGFNGCFSLNDALSCNSDGNCTWTSQGGSAGFCNPKPFSCFSSYFGNESGCNADAFCNWTSDPFAPDGGFCDGFCFSLNSTQCSANSQCESNTGFCEPSSFIGGGCSQFDGNQTGCATLDSCDYRIDTFADNNVSGGDQPGWCNDGFMSTQFSGMEGGEPTMVAVDSDGCGIGTSDVGIANQSDICGIGIKDMPNAYGFGIKVDSLDNSAICKGKPLNIFGGGGYGHGDDNASFYLYLDSDGNSTNGCDSHNGSIQGFEFFFRYETQLSGNSLSESKLSYRCVNGNWSLSPIGVSTWPEKMCAELGSVILAIDKEAIESYGEFDKSANLRIYATSSDTAGNGEDNPVDSAGPGFYTVGTVDFVAEDCRGLVDFDGDGCLPAEDPDCSLFNQYGFVPFEDCYNGVDDNADGDVDCDDSACKYDIFACPSGGGLAVDPNDNTPPGLAFSHVMSYPDGAKLVVNTFEPSNASLKFYGNVSACNEVNVTVSDGVYKPWHDLLIDNFAYNSQAIGYDLSPNETYSYRYSLCDISGNCLVSACANFTTPVSYDSCGRNCLTYLDPLDFSPPSGAAVSDPLGNLEVSYDLGADGSYDYVKEYGESSTQETLNNTGRASIKITNPNSTISWAIECLNGTIPSTISFNASNINVNESSGNGMVGMPTDEFKNKFQSDFGCDKIRLTLPFNGDVLKHCVNESTASCTDVGGNATKVSGVGTGSSGTSVWLVDTEDLGFSFYQSDTSTSSSSSSSGSSSSSSSSSSGGGGGVPTTTGEGEGDVGVQTNPSVNGGDDGSSGSEIAAVGSAEDSGDVGISGESSSGATRGIVLWVLGGVLVAGLIAAVVYFVNNRKKLKGY